MRNIQKYLTLFILILAISIAGCTSNSNNQITGGATQDGCNDDTQSCRFEFNETVIEEEPTKIVEITSQTMEQNIVINETDTLKLSLDAIDPDGDELTYSFTAPLNEEGEWKTENGDVGIYSVNISVSDGTFTTTQPITIEVLDLNFKPDILATEPKDDFVTITETESLEFQVLAEDSDGNDITYEWTVNDVTVSEDVSFMYETSYDDEGEVMISVIVSDGQESSVKNWTITIENKNREPIFETFNNIEVEETETVYIDPVATDEDGDDITFIISEPVGNNGEWETTFEDAGEYEITVIADDGKSQVEQTLTVTVLNKNRAPTVEDIESITISETEEITLEVVAADADGDELEITVSEPVGDDLVWETSFEDAGEYDVTITVTDGDLTAETTTTIVVENVNRAPILESIDSIVVNENETIIISPVALDEDGDSIEYTFSEPMTEDGVWETNFDDAGMYTVTITATDGDLTDSLEVEIEVVNVNRPPQILGVRNK